MVVYLDLCCLKRPFDDRSQPRVRLEAEAVLEILDQPHGVLAFVRSPAHAIENDQNPLPWRAARVRTWLQSIPAREFEQKRLTVRTGELMRLGIGGFDALRLACAELAEADVFATTDDRLLAFAARSPEALNVRVCDPLTLAREVVS